jgi:Arc/MetJ-type ribon-helix-helix transcriptional regulator
MKETTTEKITINVNTVDLGYIDYLVDEGHYATRTEFIKTAIKAQLDKHEPERRQLRRRSEAQGIEFFAGIGSVTRREVQARIDSGEAPGRLVCVGMLVIAPDVPLEWLTRAYASIRVYGVCRCDPSVRAHYAI